MAGNRMVVAAAIAVLAPLSCHGQAQPALPAVSSGVPNAPRPVQVLGGSQETCNAFGPWLTLVYTEALGRLGYRLDYRAYAARPLALANGWQALKPTDLRVEYRNEEFRNTPIRKVALMDNPDVYAHLHKRHADLAMKLGQVLADMKKDGVIEKYRVQAGMSRN